MLCVQLCRRLFSATPAPSTATPSTATPSTVTPLKSWQLGRLNHVAMAVPDLEAAVKLYRDVLGGEVSETVVSECLVLSVRNVLTMH